MAFRKSGKLAAAQAVIIAATVLFAVAAPRFINVMAVAENWASDLRVTFFNPPAKAQNDIVVLTINEDTLALLPYRSPIDRGFLAGVLIDLKAAGARAVGIDILFDQPTEPEKDQAFLDAVKSMGVPVVVGWTDVETGLTESQYEFQKVYLKDVAAGYSNLFKDTVDGTVRNLFPGRENDGKYRLGFASMLAEALGHEPPDQSIRIDYRGRPDAETPAFPAFPIHAMKALPQAWLAGKVVMIGADLPFGDRHRTPFAAGMGIAKGTFPGVAIQSHILSQIMEGRTAKGTNVTIEIMIAVTLASIASLLVFSQQPAAAKYAEGLITLTAFSAGAVWVFTEYRLNLPMVSPTIAFGAALGLGSAYAARLQKAEREFIHGAFSHYVSPAMVERMAENPESLKLGGEKRDLTLLFCDVRGFTTISEQFDAVGLTALINKLLTPLTNVILSNQGTVDKYMGDC
ncbi:MAG: CHASE2 domain-containing protein, partial [Rhodospirillales bacterium]